MADIEQYLREILQAVYGEEVRGSIHDAIEAMNNDIYDNTVEVKGYAESAKQSATNSEASAQRAATSASSASTSASQASSSASSASTSASQASSSATEAKSWAVGGTSSRADENTDNAKYYSDEAKRAANGISGALTARGTITFAELQEKTSEMSADTVGYMYNISTDFTTDSTFMEGSGIPYKAGTNVYWCAAQKWDCLAASVKENVIETVKVNGTALVPDAQKAVDVKAYNEDNKPEVGGRNLLTGTKDFSGNWTNHYGWVNTGETFNGLSIFRNTGEAWSSLYQEIPVEEFGEGLYTFSFYARVDNQLLVSIFTGNSGSRTFNMMPSEEMQRYSLTFRAEKQNQFKCRVEPNTTSNTYLYLCGYKLERGEVATDWSPAPEDIEAKIPTKTSQLQNDSNFITSAQIPEGVAASNTIPKPLGQEGVVGNELAFARGDHVHPLPEVGGRNLLLNSGTPITASSYEINRYRLSEKLLTGESITISIKAKLGEEKTSIGIYDSQTTHAITDNIILDENGYGHVTGEWVNYEGYTNTEIRVYGFPRLATEPECTIEWIKLERGEVATDWSPAPEDLETTADNFEGVLPIGKGGTGCDISRQQELSGEHLSVSAFRSSIELPPSGGFLSVLYLYPGDGDYIPANYSSTLLFGQRDTQGYMSVAPFSRNVIIGGGSSDTIAWKGQIAFKDDGISQFPDFKSELPTLATTTTAGLVKPGTGLSITGDGTLNVTASGSGSKLYMVEFFGLQDLAHNVIIHIPYSPTSDSTTPDIEFLKDFVSNMAKHGYPALGAYGSGKEVYEVAASLNSRDNIVINTASSSNDTFYDMFEWTITSYPLYT